MSTLQKLLLSFGIVILSAIFIYLLIIFFMRTKKKMRHNRMITMNLVIKYKPFLEYLNYQIENKEAFHVILLKVSNLSLLERKYNDQIVKSFLRMVAKELSVYLPFAGKVAQTNNRDTFIIYYPQTNEDMHLVAERFKSLASKSFHRQGVHFTRNNSLALIDHENYSLKKLSDSLVNSVRNLGSVTEYSTDLANNIEDYIQVVEKVKATDFKLRAISISKIKDATYKEIYNEVSFGNVKVVEYLSKYPTYDQPWINMYIIEYLLSELYTNNVFTNINIPVIFNTLEEENFISELEKMVLGNQFLLEQIILSIKINNVTNEEQVIKNILNLSSLGIKTSLEINNLDQEIYTLIQKYQIDRVEVSDRLMDDSGIAELLYFAKLNNVDVLYKTTTTHENLESLNVSHISTDKVKLKETSTKRRRGRK